MILFNPKNGPRKDSDPRTREIIEKTIEFFENKGKGELKADDHSRKWYGDFVQFVKENRIFSTLLTPPAYALDDPDARWDTWRNCQFNEVTAFYGLHYWYTWQVSILGLGPIWMGENEAAKHKAAGHLKDGEVFGLGLSEQHHGADIYSTETHLTEVSEGRWVANGDKYYIGNGNVARMVSTFGKMNNGEDYVFFSADSQHENYHLLKNVVAVQSYVAGFKLEDYPIAEEDILVKGKAAWDTALNTVNVGKYNLGWASVGICTHAFYESIHHAAYRKLYGMSVTDFPHVRRMLTDAYARLVAMKLFAMRACDYQRMASAEDRRYLLYNPVVKMKVTTEGERVVDLLWDVIAAKGFEEDMYFEMAARDIRALPKLEGTVHVNIALILKFLQKYLFQPKPYPAVPEMNEAAHDTYLFQQGPTKGLGHVTFHNHMEVYNAWDLPNVKVFKEQIQAFKKALIAAPPTPDQMKDIDMMLTVGDIFTSIVYGQLILESAKIQGISDHLVDQIFDCLIRDVSGYAVAFHTKRSSTPEQMEASLKIVRKPALNPDRDEAVWAEVLGYKDAYEMRR